jgi:hypothetical protein
VERFGDDDIFRFVPGGNDGNLGLQQVNHLDRRGLQDLFNLEMTGDLIYGIQDVIDIFSPTLAIPLLNGRLQALHLLGSTCPNSTLTLSSCVNVILELVRKFGGIGDSDWCGGEAAAPIRIAA